MKLVLIITTLFLTGCASCFTCGFGTDTKREFNREIGNIKGIGGQIAAICKNEIRASKGLGARIKTEFRREVRRPIGIHRDVHDVFCCGKCKK